MTGAVEVTEFVIDWMVRLEAKGVLISPFTAIEGLEDPPVLLAFQAQPPDSLLPFGMFHHRNCFDQPKPAEADIRQPALAVGVDLQNHVHSRQDTGSVI